MRIMAAWKSFAQAGTQCLAHLTSEGLMDRSLDGNETRGMSVWLSIYACIAKLSKAPELHEIPGQQVLDDSLYWVILKGEA